MEKDSAEAVCAISFHDGKLIIVYQEHNTTAADKAHSYQHLCCEKCPLSSCSNGRNHTKHFLLMSSIVTHIILHQVSIPVFTLRIIYQGRTQYREL